MNVLITGANGFIGSNLMTLLANCPDINLFAGTRDTIDLYSKKSIHDFKITHEINAIIHCAVEGNGRDTDTSENMYHNLLMFENLTTEFPGHLLINIGSGAEFDRNFNIATTFEGDFWNKVPIDYYGLSKNIIARRIFHIPNAINLRMFGCFYHNELPSRMIRKNIENYINHRPIIINQDKYMGFFYMEDFALVVKHFLNPKHLDGTPKDINMSYMKTPRLSDIANIINNLDTHTVEIVVENTNWCNNYSGYGKKLSNLNIPFKGLEQGIKECYEQLK
jgi:nucleoside-diphosphate-sugar epimerase